jgi:DNA-binding NtrC family response regulator
MPPPPPLKVLIVEDDFAMAQMCAKLVRRRGHLAIVACSCRDAERIVIGGGDIDVVVSDVQMPEMGGMQLLARLRAMKQGLPVVLMTGYSHLFDAQQAIALGAADCLIKPFDPALFVSCLERATRSRPNLTAS